MEADTPENMALRAQLAAIFRSSSQAFQSASKLALQQADLIQSGKPITAQDIATMSLQLPLIMPIIGLGADSTTGEGGGKKGKKGKTDALELSELFQHHHAFALPGINAATAAADGTKKRKRAPAKPRDPNAPKRPPSAYLIYQNELRKEIKDEHPEWTYPQVLQEISKMWAQLEEKEKKPYLDATELAKKEYEVAKAEYEKEHPAGVAEDPAVVEMAHTEELSSMEDAESPAPLVAPAKGRTSAAAGKAPASKVVEKKKAGKISLAPVPVAAEPSESDNTESSDAEGDDDEEVVKEPPKKKGRKDKAPSPPPSSSKKEKAKKKK